MGLVIVLLCNKIEIGNDKVYRTVKQNYTNKSKTMKKVHRHKTPKGDGQWVLKEPTQNILLWYLQCLWWMPMVLTDLDPKAYRF